jgi:hypothetical protein
MSKRLLATLAVAALVGAAVASTALAAMVGIYRNDMETGAQRGELLKLSGANCARGGSSNALRLVVGKRTNACAYRTPVVGRDLEVAVTSRLLSGTPRAVQQRAYLGIELRAGAGAKYQMLVYPLQRKAQLIKVTPAGPEYFAVGKNLDAVGGANMANKLRLRAVNLRRGPNRGHTSLVGYVGGERVVEGMDAQPDVLTGENTAVTVGAVKNGKGVVASVDDIVVRAPVNF